MQTDTAKDMLRVISCYLLSFKLKRVFLLIEFQRLMVWFCNLLFTDYFFLSPVNMDGKDRNGLKLEKVGPTLIRFLHESLVSYFHSNLLYYLYYQKISRVNGLFLRFTQCSSSYFISGFKQRCFWATQCQPEVSLFSFNMPWRCQICIAKSLYSYRDHLSENLQTHF